MLVEKKLYIYTNPKARSRLNSWSARLPTGASSVSNLGIAKYLFLKCIDCFYNYFAFVYNKKIKFKDKYVACAPKETSPVIETFCKCLTESMMCKCD